MIELVRKAARAGPAGVLDRLLQVGRVHAERRAVGRPTSVADVWRWLAKSDSGLREIRSAAAAGDTVRAERGLLDRMRSRAPILPAAADIGATIQLARERFADGSAAIVAAAERAVNHRFALFGWMEVDAGAQINWLREPTTGVVCPLDFWADLDLEGQAVGNLRVLWELNRHQHMLDLARAFCLTQDRRYAEETGQQRRSWLGQNPWCAGVNWASSLELALRAIAWLWAHSLLLASDGLAPGLNLAIAAALHRAGAHVARHLSYTYSPNTHLLGEALGLLYLGAMLPEFSQARRWFTLGRRILIREAAHQFLSDGFHFEHSTWYHRFATDLYLHAAIVCERAGAPLPASTLALLQRMLECLAALGARTNETALIGDDDGGQALPIAHLPAGDFRDTMAVGAALFERGDLKPHGEAPGEAVLRMLGPEGLAAYDALPPPARDDTSARLEAAGLAVMRSQEGHALTFDCGNHAAPGSAHGHAGALAIQVRSRTGPMLTDAGTYTYADPIWRAYFRGTGAHNTLRVDGEDQSLPRGAFVWTVTGEVRCGEWLSQPGFDLVEGEYRWPSGVVHWRRVLHVKPHYWIVADVVSGSGVHLLEQWFHFPPCRAALDDEGRCLADTPGGRLWIVPAVEGCEARLVEGELQPPQGWVSDAFGRKQAAPALCYRIRTALPAALIALVAPLAGDSPPLVSRLEEPADFPQSVGLHVKMRDLSHFVLLAPPDGRLRKFGPFTSDAAVALQPGAGR